MSDLVGNPEDRFSCVAARLVVFWLTEEFHFTAEDRYLTGIDHTEEIFWTRTRQFRLEPEPKLVSRNPLADGRGALVYVAGRLELD